MSSNRHVSAIFKYPGPTVLVLESAVETKTRCSLCGFTNVCRAVQIGYVELVIASSFATRRSEM